MIRELLFDWKHFRRDSRRKKPNIVNLDIFEWKIHSLHVVFYLYIESTILSQQQQSPLLTYIYAAFTEILAEVSTNIGGHQT